MRFLHSYFINCSGLRLCGFLACVFGLHLEIWNYRSVILEYSIGLCALTMTPMCYSSTELKDICTKQVNNKTIPLDVYQQLKHCGILRPFRGKRAGLLQSRCWDVISGINKDNLIQVKKVEDKNIYLTVGCVNVRSIRNKSADFIDNINNDGYDVCLITETWLSEMDDVKVVEATPHGYCFNHFPRKDKIGGGTGIVCKETMKPKLIKAGESSSFEYSEWQLKCGPSEILTVLVVYRPPYTKQHPVTVNTFISEFSDYLELVVTTPHKLIIGGDFNIHVEDPNDSESKKFLSLIESMSLKNNIWTPTHTSGHVLDLLITRKNDNLLLRDPEIRYFISDHAFIRVSTVFPKPEVQVKKISFRKIKDINIDNFKADILSSEIMCMKEMSVHQKARLYDTVLSNIIDEHAPVIVKEIKVKEGSPWYSQNLRKLKKEKRKAEVKWLKSGTDTDQIEFKRLRSDYILKCDQSKQDYYSSEVLKCGGDQRKMYKLVSRLSKGEQKTVYPDAEGDEQLCKKFGDFFVDKIDKIMSDIRETIQAENIVSDMHYNQQNHSVSAELSKFKLLDKTDVKSIITGLSTKSCCLDPIPTGLLKSCLDVLVDPIKDIVNSSLEHGEFPNCWKCATVIPLLKKAGLDLVCKSYRPVSNLSFVSKVVEKAGLAQYIDHLESANMYSPQNSAYKKQHSTESLLVRIHSDIMNNMDSQKVTLLVLLDLSAAFDTVSLDILSEIFEHRFNIKNNVLDWFQSYLTDREQRVYINKTFSEMYKLKVGVPQGSCAGPAAFLGYLSSLYDIIETHMPNVGGYADDNQLYLAFKPSSQQEETEAINSMQECIADVRKWMLTHKLKINDSKTEFLMIGTKQQLEKVNITEIKVGDSLIKPVSSARNLGVIFDSNMSMAQHINQVCKRGYHQLVKLRRIKKYIGSEAMVVIPLCIDKIFKFNKFSKVLVPQNKIISI